MRDGLFQLSPWSPVRSSKTHRTRDFIKILDGLWLIQDTCNVYIIKDKDRAIAVDFGSGQWLHELDQLGIRSLDHVFLTHHHQDQCHGLENDSSFDFTIHAPAGDKAFLDPDTRKKEIEKSSLAT